MRRCDFNCKANERAREAKFFLLPNKPCKNTTGGSVGFVAVVHSVYDNSTVVVEEGEEEEAAAWRRRDVVLVVLRVVEVADTVSDPRVLLRVVIVVVLLLREGIEDDDGCVQACTTTTLDVKCDRVKTTTSNRRATTDILAKHGYLRELKKGEIDTSFNIKEEDSYHSETSTVEFPNSVESPWSYQRAIPSLQGATRRSRDPCGSTERETEYKIQGVGPKTISVSTTAGRLAVYNSTSLLPDLSSTLSNRVVGISDKQSGYPSEPP
eukprot:scaffold126_cov178-Amphora_coffeaeformis.AAC.1